jgi:hypothetical protein
VTSAFLCGRRGWGRPGEHGRPFVTSMGERSFCRGVSADPGDSLRHHQVSPPIPGSPSGHLFESLELAAETAIEVVARRPLSPVLRHPTEMDQIKVRQKEIKAVATTLSFEEDIRPLFRETDRNSMLRHFDLWWRADVVNHQVAILQSISSGTMPCDRPWSPEQVTLLQRWIEAGFPP